MDYILISIFTALITLAITVPFFLEVSRPQGSDSIGHGSVYSDPVSSTCFENTAEQEQTELYKKLRRTQPPLSNFEIGAFLLTGRLLKMEHQPVERKSQSKTPIENLIQADRHELIRMNKKRRYCNLKTYSLRKLKPKSADRLKTSSALNKRQFLPEIIFQ